MDPQSWPFELGCAAWPQVQSKSTQQPHSTSRVPLQCRHGPAKAARVYLSPHGRPSFTMADVSHTAVSTGSLRGTSGGSCPGFSRTTSSSSLSTSIINQGQLFAVSEGA